MIDLDNIKEFALDKPTHWSVFGSPDDYDQLPDEHKDQILFLNGTVNKFLHDYLNAARLVSGPIWDPFEKETFRVIEDFTNLGNDKLLKKWL